MRIRISRVAGGWGTIFSDPLKRHASALELDRGKHRYRRNQPLIPLGRWGAWSGRLTRCFTM